ncbi:MAG: hypothetical protein J6B29_00240 [Clostridia bacterium]|nr:hypothetical protein [Clostridia bacterium]
MYEFMAKFKPESYCVKEFNYWMICVRAKQVTLGDAIILLKRQAPSIADMTSDESAEFAEVIKWYEEKCKSLFGAVKFNYVVAMMKDNFVHYHAFPRYDKAVKWNGVEWADQDWPRLVQFRDVVIEDDTLNAIINAMKD